ncbi:unnamed protein product [Effrenium voratum]|nr:unnamed protein product [Effrenium voratum]
MRLAIGEGARPNTTYKLGVVMSPVPVSENSDTSKAGRVPKIPLQNLNEGTVSTPIVVPAKEEAAWDNSSLESERGGLAVAAAWGLVVLLALFAAHPAGGAWPVLPVVASVVLVTVFLLHQVILLTSWKTKLSHRQEALAAIWIWLLSFLLSMFSSPGRREVLAGDDAWQLREDPGNSTAALWIVLVLFAAAVTVDLGFREFTALGQVIALQHLLISALLQAGSCCSDGAYPSFGGVFLGLPPWLVPSLQLHLLALGFSMVRLWMEQDKQVRAAVNDYLEGKEVPDVLAPGGGGAIKTRIEMITELLDGEIDFLQELLQKVANLASSNRAHVDWMRSVDFLLDLLTSCADVLKQSHVNNDDLEVPDLQDQLSGWIGAGAVGRQQTTPRNTEAAMMPPTASISGGVQQGVTLPGQLSPDGCGSSHSLHLQQSSSGQHWAPPGDSSLQRFADAAKDASSKSMEPIQSELPLKSEDNVRSHLMVGDWSFDALNVAAKHQSVLKIVGKEFLGERGLMPKEHLSAFLDTLESRYDAQNPYHSNVHAADMTNALYFMFENCGLQERTEVSETTVTCMFLAALGHDVGHPGFNNNFLINSRHEFALTYSDRSVLENFHSAELMRLLGGTVKGANLLSSLPVQEQKQAKTHWKRA